MKKLSWLLENPSLPALATLVGLLTLAHGLLIPWQGYSFDEWHFIYYSLLDGPKGLPELFHYDGHPQSTWVYLLAFRLLGYTPLAWHLLAFFWKTACVLMFWGLLNQVWPEKRQQAFFAALLFGLYPFFTLQVFAIAYFEVWYSFFLLWLSIFLTLKAIRQPERFWLWIALALLAKVGHLFTSEYTWFLEVFRPLFIWLVLPASLPRAEKFRRAGSIWLPYFILFFASVIWRGFFYQPLRQSFRVMEGVFNEPHMVVLAALRHWVPDSVLTLFTSWFYTLKPEYLDFGNRVNFFILLVALAGSALAWFGLKKIWRGNEPDKTGNSWAPDALAVGAIGMLAGFLPAYIAGYTAYLSEWPSNARLVLAAFPGAALILTALLELITRPRAKLAVAILLTGLLVGWHVRVNYEFLLVWESQKDFYRQLTWRIPGLRPHTMLLLVSPPYHIRLSPDSPARIAAEPDFSVSLAINALYAARPGVDGRVSYWFSSDMKSFSPGYRHEQEPSFLGSHATLYFRGEPERLVALQFNPRNRECLRVLGPEYVDYKKIPPPVKEAARRSRPENILPDSHMNLRLRNVILGADENLPWCYYYQKGALAAQFGRWQESMDLWETAARQKLRPRNGYELLPFIQSFIHSGKWEKALELTRLSHQLTPGMDAALCPAWENAQQSASPSPEQEQAEKQVNIFLKCRP